MDNKDDKKVQEFEDNSKLDSQEESSAEPKMEQPTTEATKKAAEEKHESTQ